MKRKCIKKLIILKEYRVFKILNYIFFIKNYFIKNN